MANKIKNFLILNQKKIRVFLFVVIAVLCIGYEATRRDGFVAGVYLNWVVPFSVLFLLVNFIIGKLKVKKHWLAKMFRYSLYFGKISIALFLIFFFTMFCAMISGFRSVPFLNIETITILVSISSLMLI